LLKFRQLGNVAQSFLLYLLKIINFNYYCNNLALNGKSFTTAAGKKYYSGKMIAPKVAFIKFQKVTVFNLFKTGKKGPEPSC